MSTKKIRGDLQRFRQMISGRLNEKLKKYIKTGHFLKQRPDGNGKMSVPIDTIEQPEFRFGESNEGVSRGPGEPGEVIDKEWEPGHGPRGASDQGHGGISVDVDMEDIIELLGEELCLPRMKPKNSNTFESWKTVYNDISKTGPKSLVHKKRTIKQAMKRNIAQGNWGKQVLLPGFNIPVPFLNFHNNDFFYRQWNRIKIPRSNCLIVFARDGSGSMDTLKCNIVSDMAFWIETWIKKDYEKSETLYLWHDTVAKEVSQHDFYHERHGGGTRCSTIPVLLKTMIKQKFPPENWNIYLFYFGDGDNFLKDNVMFLDAILDETLPDLQECLNIVGVIQVLAEEWEGSLCHHMVDNIDVFRYGEWMRTASVGGAKEDDDDIYYGDMDGVDRDTQLDMEMKRALVDILGVRDYYEDYSIL